MYRDRDRDDRGSGRSDAKSDCKVYVGNLPPNIRRRDLEDLFYKYGKIMEVDLHSGRTGPPFAFVEFEDPRDADDAVRGRDGYSFDGYRIKVERPRGSNSKPRNNYNSGNDRSRGFQRGNRSKGHQLLVSGLPSTGSWQDLKDHFRAAGDVIFTDVYKDGTGTVEYSRYEHMKRALRDLDDSKFKSHEGEEAYIRVKKSGDSYSRSRSRSPRGRSRSPRGRSRSPRGRSRSPRFQSRSPPGRYDRRSRSRSHSRSRSRSN